MLMRRPHSVSAEVRRLRCRTSRLSSYAPINYRGAEAAGRPGGGARCAAIDGGLRTALLAVPRRTRGRQKEGPALPRRRRWRRRCRFGRWRLVVRIIHLPDKRHEAGLGLSATAAKPQAAYRDATRQQRAGNHPIQGAVGVHVVMPICSSQPCRAAVSKLFASRGPNTWGSCPIWCQCRGGMQETLDSSVPTARGHHVRHRRRPRP